jgi:hypothetical protein
MALPSVKALTEWRTLLGTTETTPGCTVWATPSIVFEFTLDDLVDLFLRMEVLMYGRAALEIVVCKRHIFRVEIPSVPPRQTLNDMEAVGVDKWHGTSLVSDFTSD